MVKYDELIKQLRCYAKSEEDALKHFIPKLAMAEAADAIEELQSQLPRWIPVSDRLPENDKTVLVWNRRNSREYFDVYDHGRWIILEWEDITHWMPLPEPPKDSE